MKETKGSIIVKLCAIATFIVFIAGGGFALYSGYDTEDWRLFALGCGMLAFGFFLMGVLSQPLMRYERGGSLSGLSPRDCIKAGLLVMFLASCLVFFGLGIMLWIGRGLWRIGVAGIAAFIIMIFIAIEISVDYQTNGATRRVKADPHAKEYMGVVTFVEPRFPIMLFFKTVYLFYRYTVEIDGVKSSAFLKRGNKLRRGLDIDCRVTVKFNPERPLNCAIIRSERSDY